MFPLSLALADDTKNGDSDRPQLFDDVLFRTSLVRAVGERNLAEPKRSNDRRRQSSVVEASSSLTNCTDEAAHALSLVSSRRAVAVSHDFATDIDPISLHTAGSIAIQCRSEVNLWAVDAVLRAPLKQNAHRSELN